MDSKQLIIDKILQSSHQKAEAIVDSANRLSEQARLKLDEYTATAKQDAVAQARSKARQILVQTDIKAGLEQRKAVLTAKRELVDKVYEQVLEGLAALEDKRYAEFMAELVCRHAQKGDSIIICQNDVKRLDAKWLDSVNKKCGFKLSLATDFHCGKGGVILRSEGFDKKLTLEALVSMVRDSNESAVIEKLFG